MEVIDAEYRKNANMEGIDAEDRKNAEYGRYRY